MVRGAVAVLAQADNEDAECVVCMGELEPTDALVRLPCNRASKGAKAHVFHEQCLARWLLQSAACPICRRGVRPMLARPRERDPVQ